eukprot:gnl/MRDRNA2_/MRDRNA2_89298_c0_seq1.p1 gnl/MRDRNA2_/MRDRNA2_89298_c0~~gnl/MRDRNA2_/MRDRNA2_89298_c0_seq1.p1  ORF type:complete len:383 (-),score=145.48 gnl/MRDRNA2_/MRDRNA2_89298_c0_seq1:198-1346(-)
MAGKRAAAPLSPMKKKLKKSHPVNVNLEKVEGALHDHGIEVPGSKVYRKMLIAALPKAMGDGAAAEERHACQKVIVDAIGEAFSAEVTKWTAKQAEAKAELDAASGAKASAEAVLAEKQKAVDDKKADIDQKKETAHAAKTALKEAEHALATAIKAVEHHEADIIKTEQKKVQYDKSLTVTLAHLKEGKYENAKEKKSAEGKGVETLRTELGEAGADDSLTTCFHAALMKKPEDRGSFDNTVIAEVEKRMTAYIAKLSAELEGGPAAKATKEKTVEEAKAKKESCTAAQEAATEALHTAEGEKPDLDAALKAASHDDKEKAKTVKHVTSGVVATAEEGLTYAKDNYEAWKYLAERPVEEPEPEQPEEEAKPEEPVSMEAENS